mmetsp:Transcript_57390/g.94903  ORF Transcript_57390/g.94903 Transcript_57390/m.94903 type:complete len:80 (+) Transcript_57390:157-396(+)
MPPVLLVHDFTGMLWGFETLSQALQAPVLGIQCSARLLNGCRSIRVTNGTIFHYTRQPRSQAFLSVLSMPLYVGMWLVT